MSFANCKHRFRAIALLLICFVIATPLLGSHIFVSSAIQRCEFFAGVAARHHAHAEHAKASHADAKVSLLNVFLHLSGIFISAEPADLCPGSANGIFRSSVASLPLWELVFAIFDPPRAPHPAP